MDGVKQLLVKASIEEEEEDTDTVEELLETIMALDPGSIAIFLKSELEIRKPKNITNAKR